MKAVISRNDLGQVQAGEGTEFGRDLALVDIPKPQPKSGQVQIEVKAFGVNRADLVQAAGNYPPPPGATHVLGLECAGVVRQVGVGVDPSWLGRPVCALLNGGGYADYVCVPVEYVLDLPQFPKGALTASLQRDVADFGDTAVDEFVAGAAVVEAAATAWSNLVPVGGLESGSKVLIHGASGGVGSFAVQLARALGAQVFASAGNAARAKLVSQLGAQQVFDYREDLFAQAEDATGGKGFDLILDVVGAKNLDLNTSLLGNQGRLVIIGTLQGSVAQLDIRRLMSKRASVVGTTLRARPQKEKAQIVRSLKQQVWPLISQGKIRPVLAADAGELTFSQVPFEFFQSLKLDRENPLTLAAFAHKVMAGSTAKGAIRPFGKLVVRP